LQDDPGSPGDPAAVKKDVEYAQILLLGWFVIVSGGPLLFLMDESTTLETLTKARVEFEKLVGEIRPELHRYCARMTGSVVDGEDIVQDTLAKAFYLLPKTGEIANLRSWMFRIAHNKAVDHTRAYARRFGESLEEHSEIAANASPIDKHDLLKMGLGLFMRLTPAQRGAVILKDVLGHSLTEIAEILEMSLLSVKGVLHRGRAMLRKLAHETDASAPALDASEVKLLEGYVRHFAAREFDQLRALLARDVRLDIVGVSQDRGAKPVGCYFGRYSGMEDWRPYVGSVEGRPAILVFNPQDASGRPSYFILIDWVDGEVVSIRDYRHAQYVMADAQFTVEPSPAMMGGK
jgi:RNA polymerase sigma-70 factor, ECF subfamily